jgi:Flp pilus assembly protein TadD
MNRFARFALVAFLVFVGCVKHADTTGEDLSELERIDQIFNQGDYERALPAAKTFVQKYPDSYRGWALLGWVHLKTDEVEKAEECFDKSLTINPQWDNAHVGKGAACRKMGDNENARRCYLQAISIEPENAEAFTSLLVIELLEGNDEKAVEYGEKAWALRKNLPTIPANLAIAYHYLGDEAKRDYFFNEAQRLEYHNLETVQDIFDGEVSIR